MEQPDEDETMTKRHDNQDGLIGPYYYNPDWMERREGKYLSGIEDMNWWRLFWKRRSGRQ